MWAVNRLSALASFITTALTRGPLTYTVILMKLYQYKLLDLIGSISQQWILCNFHQFLEHERFLMQYLLWSHRMALEDQHTT